MLDPVPHPGLSWIQGFAIACFVVMMSTAFLTCCVIAAGPKLGAPDCPPELEIVKLS